MSLKITKASEPITVKQIVTVIYAAPGLRKSSLAFTAEAPLLLDFDHGVHRAFQRKDSVQIDSWGDVANITADDLKPFKTLVFDTTGRALDVLTVDIIAKNPKHGYGGSLSLPGYGELKGRFAAYLNLVRSFGLDIVLLVHMDEQRRGDDLIERLDMQGSSKNEVYKSADAMGRITVRNKQYLLNFSPTETAFGKNPGGFGELVVPDFGTEPQFLAGIIAKTKAALNAQSAVQIDVAKELADWQDRFEAVATAEALNALMPVVQKEASDGCRDNAKRLLLKVGKAKGWEFDATAKAFKALAPVAAPEPAQDEIDWSTPEPAAV